MSFGISKDTYAGKLLKSPEKVNKGKKNRASGKAFEVRVRKDLEEKGWIVDRWSNNVELQKENSLEVSGVMSKEGAIYGKLITAKHQYNPFTKAMTVGHGFPDFMVYKHYTECNDIELYNKLNNYYEVIGVECKCNGNLNKEEKKKCEWLLKNKIFSKILIAKKNEKGRIEYDEYKHLNTYNII